MRAKRLLTLLTFSLFFVLTTAQGLASEWQIIYLATFPRSGNHWIRYLIEEATHIATSSMYPEKDPAHLKTPFPWGGYAVDHGYEGGCRYPEPGESAVIKTHFPCFAQWRKIGPLSGTKTIRIVRHPIDSFYSLRVYNGRGKQLAPKIPKRLLLHFIDMWEKFQIFWNQQPNVLTVRYEDLYAHPHAVLWEILQAAGHTVTAEDINRAVAKYPPSGGVLKHIRHYSQEDLNLIGEQLGSLMHQFGYSVPNLETFN